MASGCYNRVFKSTLTVQDGYQEVVVYSSVTGGVDTKLRVPKYIEIPYRMSTDCRFDSKSTDAGCIGCVHQ